MAHGSGIPALFTSNPSLFLKMLMVRDSVFLLLPPADRKPRLQKKKKQVSSGVSMFQLAE